MSSEEAVDDAGRSFDRFADHVADCVASSYFFVFCVLSILVWLPSYPLFKDIDAWQLPINTFTTVVTFLLVALLHNTQHRFEIATNERLHEIIERLPDLDADPVVDPGQRPDLP